MMSDPVSGELVGQGGTPYEGANDVYGGAIMRSEGTRASHKGLGTHVGATSAWGRGQARKHALLERSKQPQKP